MYVLLCWVFFMLQSLQSVFLVFTVKHACMKRVSEDCLVKSKLYIYCRALNKQRSNNGFFQGNLKDLIRVLVTNHDFKNQVVCYYTHLAIQVFLFKRKHIASFRTVK